MPNFLIVGAPRCGTTSLAHYLSEHPDVYMSKKKELRFFNANYHLGREWYSAHFSDAGNASAVGEATPTYMYSAEALERIAAVTPPVRLIAILRNPVDRAYSHYWMMRTRGIERLSFEQALDAELSPSASKRPARPYLGYGRYAFHLARVMKVTEEFRILILEDLTKDPESTYGDLCSFLGLGSVQPPDLHRRLASFSYMPRSVRVHRLSRRLPRFVGKRLAWMNSKGTIYPKMESTLRLRLLREFQGDNAALASLMNLDLSSWAQ